MPDNIVMQILKSHLISGELSPGQEIAGDWLSRTTTRCWQPAEPPHWSVAVHVTMLVPSGKLAGALLVAAAVARSRSQFSRTQLRRLQLASLRGVACSMANSDQLNPKSASGLGPLRYVLSFTGMEPEQLPSGAEKPLADGRLRSFAVGACFARSRRMIPRMSGGTSEARGNEMAPITKGQYGRT